jgi:hypothetical protein
MNENDAGFVITVLLRRRALIFDILHEGEISSLRLKGLDHLVDHCWCFRVVKVADACDHPITACPIGELPNGIANIVMVIPVID